MLKLSISLTFKNYYLLTKQPPYNFHVIRRNNVNLIQLEH